MAEGIKTTHVWFNNKFAKICKQFKKYVSIVFQFLKSFFPNPIFCVLIFAKTILILLT